MLPYQLIKYGIVGVISTAIHFCAASLFVLLIYESLIFSNVTGFIIAFVWSYYAQSKFVFKSSLSTKKGSRFFIVQAISLVLAIYLANLTETISIYLKIFIVALMLPICAFVIHKLWTFVDDH
ncbi:GtrA family protein [Desulfobacula sp.]|uniref:GtrA family protein n=1 Tax=Desulfobacula sp. TaxID=2593537 RepID=UPI002614E3C9|nr:GtrA family protein [Desulfobacula sp.]